MSQGPLLLMQAGVEGQQQIRLDQDRYIMFLSKIIDQTLQNKPPMLIPSEQRVAKLIAHEFKNMDNITTEFVEYESGRPNLIIKYENHKNKDVPQAKTIGFMGLSMDMRPIEPKVWDENPFRVGINYKNQNIITGPGTSGSQGHIALFVQLLKFLSMNDVKLNYVIYVILTVDDHNMYSNIGTKRLIKEGRLDILKNGPIYWMGGADIHPISGACGSMGWQLTVRGKGGDSARIFETINPTMYAMIGVLGMTVLFKKQFPSTQDEGEYRFFPSNMKSTQFIETHGPINQIPEAAIIRGDVRFIPSHECEKIKKILNDYIKEINQNPSHMLSQEFAHDGEFTWQLINSNNNKDESKTKVEFELKWLDNVYEGVKCDIDSIGYKMITASTKKINGTSGIRTVTNSIPWANELKKAGFDVQIIGFGIGRMKDSDGEFCYFNEMAIGYRILLDMLLMN